MCISQTNRWSRGGLIFTTAAALALLSLARPVRAEGPASGPVVIGTANVEKIVESIHEYQDLASSMDLDRKSLQQTLQDKQNNLNAMKQALSYLKSGTPQYDDQQDKLLTATIEFDAWGKETQLDLERKQKTRIKSLFLEIKDAIAQVAEKDGINLVISDEEPQIPDNLDAITVDQLRALISQRTILYSDQTHDISGDVITLLDKNYAANAAPPAK
jgi:Skp family chaperone for outer membrane proteins